MGTGTVRHGMLWHAPYQPTRSHRACAQAWDATAGASTPADLSIGQGGG
jgi:hypothetical protein